MIKSSLLEILRTFSKKDLVSFDDFLRSPYHNKKNNVVKFFSLIKKFAPEFDDKALEKEKVWEKLYTGKAFNYGVFKNLVFELSKLAESYVSISYVKGSKLSKESLILGLRERKILGQMLKKINLHLKSSGSDITGGAEYLFKNYEMNDLLSEYYANSTFDHPSRYLSRDYLVKYFLLMYFSQTLGLYIVNRRSGKKIDMEFLNMLLSYYKDKQNLFHDTPLLKIYFSLLEALADLPNEKKYFETYKTFKDNSDKLDHQDKRDIYLVLHTISGSALDFAQLPSGKKLFMIYKDMMEDNVLVPQIKGKIDLNLYRNIIINASGLREDKFLEKFINEYHDKVETGEKEQIKNYSDAMMHLTKKNYSKCLEVFSRVEFNKLFETASLNQMLKLDLKNATLICYYELGYYDSFFDACTTFKVFIESYNMQDKSRLPWYLDYIKYFKVLVKNKIENNKDNLYLLKKEITSGNSFYRKEPLLKEIGKLID